MHEQSNDGTTWLHQVIWVTCTLITCLGCYLLVADSYQMRGKLTKFCVAWAYLNLGKGVKCLDSLLRWLRRANKLRSNIGT